MYLKYICLNRVNYIDHAKTRPPQKKSRTTLYPPVTVEVCCTTCINRSRVECFAFLNICLILVVYFSPHFVSWVSSGGPRLVIDWWQTLPTAVWSVSGNEEPKREKDGNLSTLVCWISTGLNGVKCWKQCVLLFTGLTPFLGTPWKGHCVQKWFEDKDKLWEALQSSPTSL